MSKKIISVFIVAVIACGGGFYGGMMYEQSQGGTADFAGPGNFQNMSDEERQGLFAQGGDLPSGNFGSQNGGIRPDQGGLSFGEVISVDETSMVIQLPNDAGTKIVYYSDTTEVSKNTSGSIADVAVGDSVTVMGEGTADGSMTANSIQLAPEQQ